MHLMGGALQFYLFVIPGITYTPYQNGMMRLNYIINYVGIKKSVYNK
jgi:hypothetical protein